MKKRIEASALLRMKEDDLLSMCSGQCETALCPFAKALWKYREDGYCIADNLKYLDKWIKEEEDNIRYQESKLKKSKRLLSTYRVRKRVMERLLGGKK